MRNVRKHLFLLKLFILYTALNVVVRLHTEQKNVKRKKNNTDRNLQTKFHKNAHTFPSPKPLRCSEFHEILFTG